MNVLLSVVIFVTFIRMVDKNVIFGVPSACGDRLGEYFRARATIIGIGKNVYRVYITESVIVRSASYVLHSKGFSAFSLISVYNSDFRRIYYDTERGGEHPIVGGGGGGEKRV